MATTSPDNIQYPVNSDQVAPLASHFQNLADSTQAALTTNVTPRLLPDGGGAGQILAKNTATDYDADWIDNFAPNVELYAKNQSGSAMTKGQVVYIVGVDNSGDTPRLALADADTEAASSKTIGRLKQDLADGAFGYVITEGILEGINTAAATAGQSIWLSSTAGGVVYGAPPAEPAHSVYLGVVIRSQTNNGKVYVKIQNGFELDELHGVSIDSGTLADKQVLAYEASSQLWKNKQATGGVTVGASAPSSPNNGDAWFDSNDGTLYVWYVDADTSQWVQVQANSALEGTILARLGALESQAIAYGNRGYNYIINGAFDIWQRGTSFAAAGYTADRWILLTDGSGATRAVSQQSFTPGVAPVSGYEGTYFLRYNQSVAGSAATYNIIEQRIEDVRTLAGQTITVSFWAKAAANTTVTSQVQQNFGSGGSAEVQAVATQTISLTTSWQRFTYTATMPSISGKTIGTSSYVAARFNFPNNAVFTADVWGVQVEAGSVATAFRTNTSNKQAELAACQRYYYRWNGQGIETIPLLGQMWSVNEYYIPLTFFVPMRTSPTVEYSALGDFRCYSNGAGLTFTSMVFYGSSAPGAGNALRGNISTNTTANAPMMFAIMAGATKYLALNAELI